MADVTPITKTEAAALANRSNKLKRELEDCQQERNSAWAQLLELQIESEARIGQLQARTDHLEADLHAEHAAHSEQVFALQQAATERETEIATLSQGLTERDQRIDTLNQALTEIAQQRSAAAQDVLDRDSHIASLHRALQQREGQLAELYASSSWRLTAPLRFLKRRWPKINALIASWLGALYVALPLPWTLKLKIKGLIFAVLSPLLRHTRAYRAWVEFEQSRL